MREAQEMSFTAMQLRIQKEQAKIDRLLDLYASGDLEREAYLAKRKEIEATIESITVQAKDVEKHLAENPVILPEQEDALRRFQHVIASRMTDDVLMPEKRKLLDLLRVEAYWNSETKQLTIAGLIIDSVVNMSR